MLRLTPGIVLTDFGDRYGKLVLLDVDDVPGATSYRWYLNGVLKATTTTSSYQLPMNGNVSCGNSYYFGVRANGPCGLSQESYVNAQMPPCNPGFRITPNPATDIIKIESMAASAKAGTGKSAVIESVELYDKTGVIKLKRSFGRGQKTVSLAIKNLPGGLYTVRIFDGQNWQSMKVVIGLK